MGPIKFAPIIALTTLLACSSTTQPEVSGASDTAGGGSTSASSSGATSGSSSGSGGGATTSGGTTGTASAGSTSGETSTGGASGTTSAGNDDAGAGIGTTGDVTGGLATGGSASVSSTGSTGARDGGGPTTGGGTTGSTSSGDAGTGGCVGTNCATTVITYPTLPGAVKSPLYTVTANGTSLFVEKMTKFAPEMQVHYAHCSLSGTGTATFSVTVGESFTSYTVSPKSRNLTATKSGNTITFASGTNYLILQFDTKELLFILIDPAETNPPRLGDANVKNIADYTVDNTGATLVTSKVQAAIDAASSSTQNILYFPPGKYLVGELWMKSNVTLYLAGGAVLYGSSNTNDFNTGAGGINIEGAQHALLRMYQIKNAKILGRGVLDSNGHYIRGQNLNANLLKIEQSSNITVDGILSRDPSYWNTLVYRSDQVSIQNYKVINCRPSAAGGYNQTDGVDFDESTNGTVKNAFLYTGDDSMAPKNEDPNGTINSKNLSYQHVVAYSNSVGCKIGTKSMGQSMDTITFDDVDVVKAGRAMTIEAYDTALVSNITFSNIRVETADSILINLALDMPPTWRTAADTGPYKDIYFTNVSSDVKQIITMHGKSATVNIDGVHFKNLTVQGKPITSQTDTDVSWSINQFVSGITFQ